MNTKLHVICDSHGRPINLFVTAGPVSGYIGARALLSSLPFDEWTETFGSERLTSALLDRLTHHVSILEMNGESYRLASSTARKRR